MCVEIRFIVWEIGEKYLLKDYYRKDILVGRLLYQFS